ncbi:MAG: hypothetical protein IPJ11_10205 [Gemmatimonadetes bacterium]|nr:hypothetical protein [Gemmatimonadota bacterium]
MKAPRLILSLIALAHLTTAPLPAQGPRPLGLQQPAPTASAPARRDLAPTEFDATHVKPNHWKRGAVIGTIVAMTPVALYMVSHGCGNGGSNLCLGVGIGMLGLAGMIGWMTGGLIGSFFPK